ncbi:hypothetical protein [Haloplanus pelagicus]|jgi:hypothetical protein|uniref:hypothetical protein n=1 Tax=Haloplanus pelagicus TaxID=2949995 RepID=UPI0020407D23|nr:hypothetical protein [Haloplanus sp. HW8-1]
MAESDPTPPTVVSAPDGTDRLWVSEWYRIAPQTFEHFELFFQPDAVYAVFAEESFKSLLLRRDGRNRAAREVGSRALTASADRLLDDERSFGIPITEITAVRTVPGSLLAKPTLTVDTTTTEHTFHHSSRRYDVDGLRRRLGRLYEDAGFDVTAASRDWMGRLRGE